MAIRTVRLDREAEENLRQIREATGLPISETFKQGLRSLKRQVQENPATRPFDIYEKLDLGPGGYAQTPSTEVKLGVGAAIRKKLRK